MATATILDIKNALLVNAKALGNSDRGLKEVVSDLLNQYGRDQAKYIAEKAFLSVQTVHRLMDLTETENGDPYRPQCDTIERVLKVCGAEIHFDQVKISPRYMPGPKYDYED